MSQSQQFLLETCKQNLKANRILLVISSLQQYISTSCGFSGVKEKLEALKEDYNRMLIFFKQGVSDPQKEIIFKGYRETLWEILQDMNMMERCNDNGTVFSAASLRIRNFEEDKILSMLKGDQVAETGETRDDYYNMLFSFLLVSLHWSKSQEELYVKLILSTEVDIEARLLMISAIMLSCMTVYDIAKFSCLVKVYQVSQELKVKERALVGWVFSLYHNSGIDATPQQELIRQLCQDEAVCQELLELQKQIIYCLDAEKDASVLRDKYMPELMKNVPRHGFMPKDELEESSLEEILHPQEEEEKVERLERAIRNIVDMENAGSDVYFAGFSQMKSFGFFHSLFHWFMPFSLDNPVVSSIFKKIPGSEEFLRKVQQTAPFCDNDKYSFAFALNIAVGQMDLLRQLLKDNVDFNGSRDSEMDEQNPSWIRRMYLQDLYRFFKLSLMRKDFVNPFDDSNSQTTAFFFSQKDFSGKAYEQAHLGICRFLAKRKDYARLGHFIYSFTSSDVDYAMMVALYEYHHARHYELASNKLASILLKNPHNLPALKLLARCYFAMENYEDAVDIYTRIKEEGIDTLQINLHLAFCWIEIGEYGKAVKLLYELNYHHPNNIDILRALAWGLIQKDELEKANQFYKQIFEIQENEQLPVDTEDYYNQGICLWCMHEISQAASFFALYRRDEKEITLYGKLMEDRRLLDKHQITKLDMLLMVDAVDME